MNKLPSIDLEWAKQKIPGFAQMVETQKRVKESEQKYKKLSSKK